MSAPMSFVIRDFYLILFAIVGLVSLLTALLCPDWLLSSRGARIWINAFGKRGAHIFYIIIGVALLSAAAFGLIKL